MGTLVSGLSSEFVAIRREEQTRMNAFTLAVMLRSILPKGQFTITNEAGEIVLIIHITDKQLFFRDKDGKSYGSFLFGVL